MKFEIKHRLTAAVMFTAEITATTTTPHNMQIGLAVQAAIMSRANLSGANLSGADLSRANLYGANLSGADLSGADLSRANLYGANLSGANLYGADLSRANLYGANLYGADLYGANLYGANLSGADLSRANLSGANLYGANLSGASLSRANLSGADLSRANLSGANLSGAKCEKVKGLTISILPDGDIIGWKKLQDGVIAKVSIPAKAKRVNSTERKCRAAYVKTLAMFGRDGKPFRGTGIAQHDNKTQYRVGRITKPNSFDADFRVTCSFGIHFFITRDEAEAY